MHAADAVLVGFGARGEELCHALGATCMQAAAESTVSLDAFAECGARGDWIQQGFCELRDRVEKGGEKALKQWLVTCDQWLVASEKTVTEDFYRVPYPVT